MKLKKNSSEQKLRGAYYTPLKLADAMVNLFTSEQITSILEPSCGDGVFLDALKRASMLEKKIAIDAIEIEDVEANKASANFKGFTNINVYNEDFLEFYSKATGVRTYDLILGNPPYIRYQYLTEPQRELQSKILQSNGMKSNKLINAWVCFLVACTELLSMNGKIAFVIPAEILQVAYAEDLRLFLSNTFSKITLITFEKLVFPVEQEVLVFIGEKGKEEKGIRIVEMQDLNDFEKLDLDSNGFQKLNHVKEKWTKYFITAEDVKIVQKIKNDRRFAEFSSFGVINVGITTGNNDYFSIDKEVEKQFELENVTLPLIGRSSHAHGIYFTCEDHLSNVNSGKKSKLIAFPNTQYEDYPELHKQYIAKGEQEEQHIGYKCSIRDRWYIVPSIWTPDAFFLRRNNLYPKFVLNNCEAVSTDTMHRIKFFEDVNSNNVLLSYYNSISFAFTEICGRSYGGGVLEILPREMGCIMLPKVSELDENLRTELLKEVDTIVRNNSNIEQALDIVDKKLLVDVLEIEKELCIECRKIWKKLRQRRLKRSC